MTFKSKYNTFHLKKRISKRHLLNISLNVLIPCHGHVYDANWPKCPPTGIAYTDNIHVELQSMIFAHQNHSKCRDISRNLVGHFLKYHVTVINTKCSKTMLINSLMWIDVCMCHYNGLSPTRRQVIIWTLEMLTFVNHILNNKFK